MKDRRRRIVLPGRTAPAKPVPARKPEPAPQRWIWEAFTIIGAPLTETAVRIAAEYSRRSGNDVTGYWVAHMADRGALHVHSAQRVYWVSPQEGRQVFVDFVEARHWDQGGPRITRLGSNGYSETYVEAKPEGEFINALIKYGPDSSDSAAEEF